MRIREGLAALGIVAIATLSVVHTYAFADEFDAELKPVKITGYCTEGITSSGIETRKGICAYRPQDIGKVAVVYNADKELVGMLC